MQVTSIHSSGRHYTHHRREKWYKSHSYKKWELNKQTEKYQWYNNGTSIIEVDICFLIGLKGLVCKKKFIPGTVNKSKNVKLDMSWKYSLGQSLILLFY